MEPLMWHLAGDPALIPPLWPWRLRVFITTTTLLPHPSPRPAGSLDVLSDIPGRPESEAGRRKSFLTASHTHSYTRTHKHAQTKCFLHPRAICESILAPGGEVSVGWACGTQTEMTLRRGTVAGGVGGWRVEGGGGTLLSPGYTDWNCVTRMELQAGCLYLKKKKKKKENGWHNKSHTHTTGSLSSALHRHDNT